MTKRKALIIGGGVAGPVLALFLKSPASVSTSSKPPPAPATPAEHSASLPTA